MPTIVPSSLLRSFFKKNMKIIFLVYTEVFVRLRRTTMIAATVITVTRTAISKIVAVLSG
jgi:hypothetical protein